MKNPKVLLCDEPTGALHQEAGHEVMQMLKKTSSQALVLIVSHDEDLLKTYCDEIVILENGRLKGTTHEAHYEIIPERKKKHYSLLPYAIKEVMFRAKRLISLICFQIILLSCLLFMVEGLHGLNFAINQSVEHAPLMFILFQERIRKILD